MIYNILCDTDFLISLLIKSEPNHLKAKSLLEDKIDSNWLHTNLTKYELMTVLSRKLNQETAVKVFELFESIFENEVEFNRELESEIIDYYKKSKSKNQSFFDIACLVQAKHFDYKIASFDSFYPKEILIS